MLLAGKQSVLDLTVHYARIIEYHKVSEVDTWQVNFLKEMLEIQQNEIEVPGMLKEELDQIFNYICTNPSAFVICFSAMAPIAGEWFFSSAKLNIFPNMVLIKLFVWGLTFFENVVSQFIPRFE